MTQQYLLEIGLEELPAHVVKPSMIQLKEKTEKFLAENSLTYSDVDMFSTPRRLGVRVNGLEEKQADVEEEVKGPAKKIALDEAGNWSKAAEGFVRGQGLTPEDIYFKEIKGVEYVHVNKFIKGKEAKEVIAGIEKVITSLTFPVTMRWSSYDFEYIRPIHWLVSLLDDEIIPIRVLDVKAGRTSRGHRFLGKEAMIDHAANYETALKEQFVYVNASERENLIKAQINEIAENNQWKIVFDEDLLDEVNNLVEYPTAFSGAYDAKYLDVPEEVLVTSMKEHQRYFDVRNAKGELLPYFISVRNGNKEHLQNVVQGNEKVLTARLEDAEFFYNEDKELSIDTCVKKLRHVTFHEKIGTMSEKMERVAAISELIGKQVGLSEEELVDLNRAAAIYKFDIVTHMVDEFPELQGIMGEKYARMQGETPVVALAIKEHYMPTSSEGELPQSAVGAVLAISDKIDSVLSFFSVGMIPSGSNDPYALRRQTYGIIRIVESMGWHFPLSQLQNEIIEVINGDIDRYGIELAQNTTNVTEFVKGRMKQFLGTKGIRHDIIEAVTNANQNDLATMMEAALVIKEHREDTDFKIAMEALTRVMNLSVKGKELLSEELTKPVDIALFENMEETELYQAVAELEEKFSKRSLTENFEELKNLYPVIEKYFDKTMVMVDDKSVRDNRLRQLEKIASIALSIASLDLLTIKK